MNLIVVNNYITQASATDPNFANVVLLAHMEGSDEGTSFTDSSSVGRTITAVGNTNTEVDQFKFGSSSGEFDGTGDKLTVPDHSDFYLGIADGYSNTPFTVEGWIRLNDTTNQDVFFGRSTTVSGWRVTDGIAYLFFTSGGSLYWQFWTSGASPNTISETLSNLGASANTWYHVAISYDGTTTEAYFNGSRFGTSTASYNNPGTTSYTVALGGSGVSSHDYSGFQDDWRITNGTGRYTGTTLTVPTAAFPDS